MQSFFIEKWSSVDTPQQSAPAPLPEGEKVSVSSPPPGFKGFSAIGGETKQSWIPTAEKTGLFIILLVVCESNT